MGQRGQSQERERHGRLDQTAAANYPATGSNDDGTAKSVLNVSQALGATNNVELGRLNSDGTGHGPLSSGTTAKVNSIDATNHPLYGLSHVITILPENKDREALIALYNATDAITGLLRGILRATK